VIDLNQFVRNGDVGDLGALKTTTQKFYRIGSTQLEGEQRYCNARQVCLLKWVNDVENAMPWDKIDPAEYYLGQNR
jgi:carboxyl-terminal processing protease